MEEKQYLDKIELVGIINSKPIITHTKLYENFYEFELSIERNSGEVDVLPIVCSERIFKESFVIGTKLHILGDIRTRNVMEGEKRKLQVKVFAKDIKITEENLTNNAELVGVIVKQPNYRTTPLGREISDVILATNTKYGKSFYIPCIIWGRNAKFVSQLEVGTNVAFTGRLQSRKYFKNEIEKTAYEMSVGTMKVVKDGE